GSMTEAEVNLRIAQAVVSQLQSAGVQVDLLPATVPPGYDADAFVAIHADSGGRSLSGFKVSTPWRASRASKVLRDSVADTYSQVTGLPMDRYGISYNMRGYYAFSYYRFLHAVAPSTPCMIIETGFLTSALDRQVIVDQPERAARGISEGIISYLGERATMRPSDLVPLVYAPLEVATDQAALRYYPRDGERVMGRLASGTLVRVFDERDGWAELMVFGHFRLQGWMKLSDLRGVADFYGGTTKARALDPSAHGSPGSS
ncbi:MAG TPA: N-acetylmuramoyl-L-alanine amidase, partial [Spirochaetia bacterium]|nr:N-acetylmuramoyl-L-alanine amidase [Spirochaetia bacterium]